MEAELFGFYSLCGKSAAIMGPLVFGGISHAAGGNQRAGILAVGAFFVVGLLLLWRCRAGGPTAAPRRADREPGYHADSPRRTAAPPHRGGFLDTQPDGA